MEEPMKKARIALLALALAVCAQAAPAAVHIPRRHLPRVPPVTRPHIPRRHLQQAPRTSPPAIVTAPITVLCGMLPFLPRCTVNP
jgi:hypothetical protein